MSTFERARALGQITHTAHHKDPWTSHEAARRSSLKPGLYRVIVEVMRFMPGHSGTSEQISAFAISVGRPIDAIDVARRMSKLKEKGYVRHRGDVANSKKGNPCTIWELIT